MFENLSDKLQRAFKNLRGEGTVSEENINDALREIRVALLEADVNLSVVKEMIEHVREKAMGSEVMTALSRRPPASWRRGCRRAAIDRCWSLWTCIARRRASS